MAQLGTTVTFALDMAWRGRQGGDRMEATLPRRRPFMATIEQPALIAEDRVMLTGIS